MVYIDMINQDRLDKRMFHIMVGRFVSPNLSFHDGMPQTPYAEPRRPTLCMEAVRVWANYWRIRDAYITDGIIEPPLNCPLFKCEFMFGLAIENAIRKGMCLPEIIISDDYYKLELGINSHSMGVFCLFLHLDEYLNCWEKSEERIRLVLSDSTPIASSLIWIKQCIRKSRKQPPAWIDIAKLLIAHGISMLTDHNELIDKVINCESMPMKSKYTCLGVLFQYITDVGIDNLDEKTGNPELLKYAKIIASKKFYLYR